MFLNRFRKAKPLDDQTLVIAYRDAGDLGVLGELYERHMDLVYAVCYNYLRNEDDAKDAVMQLFEQLVVDLRRHDVQQFVPWLHTVARNYCLMLLRKRQTHPVAVLLDTTTDGYDIADIFMEEQTDREENLSRLETCLKTLPPEQQTCLTLFYIDQKSYAEVASLTGFDLKQVKSHLQNGRRMLKICMNT